MRVIDNMCAKLSRVGQDMVDTTLFDPKNPQFKAETLLKIMMGAVDQPLDHGYPFRRGASD